MYEIEIAQLKSNIIKKLAIGRKRIDSINSNPEMMCLVLISYHGALEDYFRATLMQKKQTMTDAQKEILDRNATKWKQLLEKGKDCLGLSEEDADFIDEANTHRNIVGHGLEFNWTQDKLENYCNKVEKWCGLSELGTVEPTPIYPNNDTTVTKPNDWYRSTAFMWFAFLFLNPLWIILILTDRNRSGCLKIILVLCIIYLISVCCVSYVLLSRNFPNLPAISKLVPFQNAIPNFQLDGFEPRIQTTQKTTPTNTKTETCQVVWEEYKKTDIVGKNRSMIWNEIVSDRIRGSGITAQQFYALVLEYNPTLKTDGYVFKEKTIYKLPVCK